MATIKENTTEYTCHYGHKFIGKEVKLMPFRNESRELLGRVVYTQDDAGELFTGGRAKEGYLLACPHCEIIQIGGFLVSGEKPTADALAMASAEKRNIVLGL